MHELAQDKGVKTVQGKNNILEIKNLYVFYGMFKAVESVSLDIPEHHITALIGPSGCGKSTVLRSINRMNDLIPGTRTEVTIRFEAQDIFDASIDPVRLRKRIGVVFQKLNQNVLQLSGGQQQRLCIARAIAVEPSSALEPKNSHTADYIAGRFGLSVIIKDL